MGLEPVGVTLAVAPARSSELCGPRLARWRRQARVLDAAVVGVPLVILAPRALERDGHTHAESLVSTSPRVSKTVIVYGSPVLVKRAGMGQPRVICMSKFASRVMHCTNAMVATSWPKSSFLSLKRPSVAH